MPQSIRLFNQYAKNLDEYANDLYSFNQYTNNPYGFSQYANNLYGFNQYANNLYGFNQDANNLYGFAQPETPRRDLLQYEDELSVPLMSVVADKKFLARSRPRPQSAFAMHNPGSEPYSPSSVFFGV